MLDVVRTVRRERDVPIVLFGYYNPLLAYGEDRFARDASAAGVDGVLVVDLPPEEAAPLLDPLSAAGLDFVPLVAPTSTGVRVDAASAVATAFLYYVSLTGVTGAAQPDLGAAAVRAAELSRRTGRPVALGFGVKTPDDVRAVAARADGVVVGSAVVSAAFAAPDAAQRVARVADLVAQLARATRRG